MVEKETHIDTCDLCGADSFSLLYSRNKFHSSIVTCDRCGLTFSNPQVQLKYAEHRVYIKKYLQNEVGRRKTAHWRIDQFRRLKTSARLFEIGCSGGLFLDEARKAGFEVSGSELNRAAVEYARNTLGLTVFEEIDLSKIDTSHKWDVVVMFNVLEHVSKPTELIRFIIDEMLTKDGLFVVEIPNIFTFLSKIEGNRAQHLSFAHYYYFSQVTLSRLVNQLGLEILQMQWGKRIYPIGISSDLLLRRYPSMKSVVSRLLKSMHLYDLVVPFRTHDFIFCVTQKPDTPIGI